MIQVHRIAKPTDGFTWPTYINEEFIKWFGECPSRSGSRSITMISTGESVFEITESPADILKQLEAIRQSESRSTDKV